MSANRQPRAVGYVRVSTEEQVDNHSLRAQEREIERFCERKGFQFLRTYSDAGFSAHHEDIEKRPQLIALLNDAQSGLFDVVIVHTLDRWSRNMGAQRKALRLLGEAGVGFASCTEDFDFTTPSGKFMMTTIGGVSEFFSDQLAVHTKKGIRERAVSGLPVGPVPFGYLVDPEKGIPVVVEEEARAIAEMFELRASGGSMPSIADRFNRMGLNTRKGARFTSHSIKDMLACPFYKGIVSLNGEEFPGQHDRIVSDTLFERVEVMRLRRQRAPKRSRGGRTGILRQLTACAICGKSMHSERNHRGHPMYRERHGQGCPTDGRSIAASRIDTQIGQVFGSIQLPESWQDRMVSLVQSERPEADLEDLRARKSRIARAYVDGGLTEAEYSDRLQEIDDQLQALETPADEDPGTAAELFRSVGNLWDEATPDERQRLVAPLLDRVYVDIETKLIAAIVPAPAFKPLLDNAVEQAPDAQCVIIGPSEGPQTERGSVWWRRGRLRLPVPIGV